MTYEDTLIALADPTRRKIFESLSAEPQSVADIADKFSVSRPAISQHLKILTEAELASFQTAGNRNLYRRNRKGLEALRAYLEQYWDDVLEAFSNEIENQGGNNG